MNHISQSVQYKPGRGGSARLISGFRPTMDKETLLGSNRHSLYSPSLDVYSFTAWCLETLVVAIN